MNRRAEDDEEFDPKEYRSEAKIPRWALSIAVLLLFGVCGFFIKNIYADVNGAKELAQKHETALPFIQASLNRLDQRQDKMDEKLDRILSAVRN